MMSRQYLGETLIEDRSGTPFEGYTSRDWALYFIGNLGQIDGARHKQWVLDQVARILLWTPVVINLARWDDGQSEYRVHVSDNVSQEYLKWRNRMKGEYDEENDEYEYDYDEGIAP